MKGFIILLLAISLLLTGCNGGALPSEAETAETATVEAAFSQTEATFAPQTTTSAPQTTISAQTVPPEETEPAPLVNEDGTLAESYRQRLNTLRDRLLPSAYAQSVNPSLYDLDEDGVPEIIVNFSSGGQGNSPCRVYDARTLECIGEFSGFNRDGFTRFSQGFGGTVMHRYFEHSYWQRGESYSLLKLTDGKLETTLLYESCAQAESPLLEMVYSEEYANTDYISAGQLGSGTRRAEEICISSFGYNDVHYLERYDLVFNMYNEYICLRDTAKEQGADYFSAADFDGDGKQECFFVKLMEGAYFLSSEGVITSLWEMTGIDCCYRLWDDMIVFQPYGNSMPCAVYRVERGVPVRLDTAGMLFDYSALYNGCFEIVQSVYDITASVDAEGGVTGHSFKKYSYFIDEASGGLREHGSVIVDTKLFLDEYGDSISAVREKIAEQGGYIAEVLYRSDTAYIINYNEPVSEDGYFVNRYNVLLKPDLENGGLRDIKWDSGKYLTALTPEIAVYPEEIPFRRSAVDTDLFNKIYIEEIDEYSASLFAKWQEELKKTDFPKDRYIDCIRFGDYVVSYASGWYAGPGGPYLVIMSGENIHIIEEDYYLGGGGYFFEHEGSLYIYDHYLQNGISHTYFIEYSLSSGEKLGSYAEYHDIGLTASDADVASFNTDYKGFCEVERDMLSMTDTLCRCTGLDNPLFEETSEP